MYFVAGVAIPPTGGGGFGPKPVVMMGKIFRPTFQPSSRPTFQPSNLLALRPSNLPTFQPSDLPALQPVIDVQLAVHINSS